MSSPASVLTMNSFDAEPPIAPEEASTITYCKATAIEDSLVSFALIVERLVETALVDVKGIGIFHDELPNAQHTRLRSRFIAKLYLDLIPNLGQLFVGIADRCGRWK